MAATLPVSPDLDEIRDQSEQAMSDVVDGTVGPAVSRGVDRALSEFEALPEGFAEKIKDSVTKTLIKALKPVLYDVAWAVIQGAVHPDKLGAGLTLIVRTVQDLLSTPEGLREKAARARRHGNEQKAQRLEQRAKELEEARMGNDR